MFVLKLFLLFFLFNNGFSRYSEIGEFCQMGEFIGSCKLWYECPIAFKIINEDRQQPPTCFHSGNTSVVCCPTNDIVTGPKIMVNMFQTSRTIKNELMSCIYDDREPFLCCANPPEKQDHAEPKGCPELPKPKLVSAVKHPAWEKCVSYQRYFNVCVAIDDTNTKFTRNDTTSNIAKKDAVRIMGGIPAELRQYPHMAVIGSADSKDQTTDIRWIGGGSLISDKFILTAAHVVIQTIGGVARYALLGTLNKKNIKEGLLVNIIKRHGYPEYVDQNRDVKDHDIALVELFQRVQFNEFIRPACLPVPDRQVEDFYTVAGWGQTESSHNSSTLLFTYLRDGDLNCKRMYGESYNPDIMICTRGAQTMSNDACKGDSGGPLMASFTNLNRSYSIEGVVSYGLGCGRGAGIFTRVSKYMDFIMQTVWPEEWAEYKQQTKPAA